MTMRRAFGCVLALVVLTAGTIAGGTRKFFDDDPIANEPETQDASGATPYDINLVWDLSYNLFANPARSQPKVRAKNLNTIDEVPDSGWFVNRILRQPLSAEDVARGPVTGTGPTGRLTIIAPKSAGALKASSLPLAGCATASAVACRQTRGAGVPP
jgi:hypothetical protein